MRVVADTNVLVSAVVSKSGSAAEFLKHWKEQRFTLVTSPFILKEVEAVLNREKIWKTYGLFPEDRSVTVDVLRRQSVVVYPVSVDAVVSEDPSDDHILAAATEGNASIVVSGDRHLLHVKAHRGIRMVSLARFLKKYQ